MFTINIHKYCRLYCETKYENIHTDHDLFPNVYQRHAKSFLEVLLSVYVTGGKFIASCSLSQEKRH
jgi:hypothetical protein